MDRKEIPDFPGSAADGDWFERSEYWQSYRSPTGGSRRKYFHREPLILCGHGAGIRVDRGSLLIRGGFTHYPQTRKEIRLFFGDPNLPDRIVMLDGSGAITFDALAWMSDQRITLVKINWRGQVAFVSGNSGYSAKKDIYAAQNKFCGTKSASLFSRQLLEQKIRNSISTLKNGLPKSENRDTAILALENAFRKFTAIKGPVAGPKLLGIEGGAAFAYFHGWHGTPLKWRGLWKKPLPPSWREIGPRRMTWRAGADNARHPVNAMLNYAYAMLVSQVRSELVAQGIDPTIGISHGTYQNRIPLVYDLIEPLRPVVDLAVLGFVLARTFAPGDFTINRFGACRINPQLATALARSVPTTDGAPEIVRRYLSVIGNRAK
jgi:CRISPR-associated endonuclease Cas1